MSSSAFFPIYNCKLINITNEHYLNYVIYANYHLLHCITLLNAVNKAKQIELQFEKPALWCCATLRLQKWTSNVFDGHFKKNHRFKSAEIFLLPFFCGLTAIFSKRPFLFTVSTLTAWRQDNGDSIMFRI